MSILQLSGGLVLLLGAALLVVGGRRFAVKKAFLASARSIDGKVVDLVGSGSSVFASSAPEGRAPFREQDSLHSGVALAPVIEFTAPGGKVSRIRSKVSSNPPRYAVGDVVRLLCPADSPERAIIDGFAEKWMLETFLFGFGVLLLAVGTLLVLL